MATTIYLTEAFERLVTQIDPLDAKNCLEEWGFDGVLDYYGAKSLRFFADCCCEKGAPSGQLAVSERS
jgi:hypothetical protein